MTYANVMSTLAVFIALGGSSYAAVKVSGSSIRNRSIPADKLRRNSLTGREIRESRLGRVPAAADAGRLDGLTADQLRVHCPPDTFGVEGVCVERTPRPATPYDGAVLTCLQAGGFSGIGRRLPTHGELRAALAGVQLAPGGELTSNVYPSTTDAGELNDLVVVDQAGAVTLVPDRAPEGSRQYRCVTEPTN
jgi:hypothetical protein